MSEGKNKTWLEVNAERKLAKDAVIPPSQEQVDEEIARQRKSISDKNKVKEAVSDIQYETARQASNAKNN